MPQTSRLIPLLIAVAGAGCVRSSAPVGTDALAGRVTAYAPVPADPPASPGPPKPPEQPGPPAPTLPGPEPITLAEARALAERVNPQLNRVRETVNRAAAEERIVFADFLPSLGFRHEFDAVTSRSGFTGVKPGRRFAQLPVRGYGPGAQDFEVLDLELRHTVFQFGKRLARHDQAVLRWDVARLQTERARQSVAFDVSARYAELLETFAAREIAERTVGRAEAVLKDAVNLEKQGVLTREDVLRAEVQVADARQALTSARSAVSVTHAALNRAIGITVGYPTRVTEDALPIERATAPAAARPPVFDLELEQCLDFAVRNRPEFVVVQKAIQVASRGVDATRADYLPTFGTRVTGSVVDGVAVQNATVLNAGIFMTWDFFAGGRRVGAVLAAESDVRAAAAEAQQMCDTIAFEVHVAFANIEDARERIKQTRKAVEQARETLRLVQARYARGDAKPTDVVDAQTALTRAEQNANDARYAYLIALAQMEFATGVPLAALLRPADPDALPPPRPVLPPKGAGGVGGKGP
ncbi:outer membrane efflux protein : Protein CyaE OS=Desulfobacca acetoxidans (strain ATCC 700848 / DSM 11109 / ASRB2) GN=Desac_0157 PE=3 SV=1: OEP: OEP [Gemmataceae bacterium]|nr:outer membrane efflux protein : Protein CyaE OS=Desulfobacca acetoxidans (strain ATCC 700848 / DSM 11109 / ASRB2) GN=Desac_0157 PE=3 SV=1: OEP: OEP [Gemmataceae bacterium]VTT98362.1 outer membrane efflux protein : Protein CyaE OS=Desulfobacca acetoxidans (strain ATCC 700848 / DSM 11109 / ASRB2) GN=Desac_0157 PE=3 SV=1: OEP: OEP [Gemmataceae bacterium]